MVRVSFLMKLIYTNQFEKKRKKNLFEVKKNKINKKIRARKSSVCFVKSRKKMIALVTLSQKNQPHKPLLRSNELFLDNMKKTWGVGLGHY